MTIEHIIPLPDKCMPVASVEIVCYLEEDGSRNIALRVAGNESLTNFLGMIEYGRLELWDDYKRSQEQDEG